MVENKQFKVAIIGLGLMGGSLAYALRGFRDCVRIGYDINETAMRKAKLCGAVDIAASTPDEAMQDADLTVFCITPSAIMETMREHVQSLKAGSVICDICGVKGEIFDFLHSAKPDGVDYIGVHPMAGKEVGGFENADPQIFKNAGFIITPPDEYRASSLELIEDMARYVGVGRICISDPETHDRIIGYTSDLMHIAATALCETYPADMTMAYTAGAFRDCTRIANIDAALWTDLFSKNAAHILPHLERLVDALSGFQAALENGDQVFMYEFLRRAGENKKEMMTL